MPKNAFLGFFEHLDRKIARFLARPDSWRQKKLVYFGAKSQAAKNRYLKKVPRGSAGGRIPDGGRLPPPQIRWWLRPLKI